MFVEHEKREAPLFREPHESALDKAGQILLAAATMLEREGWCQGSMYSEGRLCVLGAIGAAGHYGPASYDARDRLRRVVGDGIADWNDTPGRTKHEVVATLRRVALGE